MAFPANARNAYYAKGEWNVECSMCGFVFKSSEVVKNWQGMYRCFKCNETRHPQDFVRPKPDIQTVPFSQPPKENFVYVCSLPGRLGIPGFALPGCAICSLVFDYSGFPHPELPPGPVTPPATTDVDQYFDAQYFANNFFKLYF